MRMRALRLHAAGELALHEEQPPVAAPGTTQVRVGAVGLCGSDLHWFGEGGIGDAALDRPLVLGHEFAGTVIGGPLDGRLVAVDPAMPCGKCHTCAAGLGHLCPDVVFAGHGKQDGGLQEVVSWPTARLHPLPSSLSDEDGAMLEPLGVALHALDLGHVRAGATVAVHGCGPIGLLLVQLLAATGGRVVAVDALPHRQAAAGQLGADVALSADEAQDPQALEDATGGRGADVAFEVAGTDGAVHDAMSVTRPGGRVVLVGIPDEDRTSFRASLARRKGLTLLLSRRMGEVYPRAIRLVERGIVDVRTVVTHRFDLADAPAAFDAAAARTGHKVVVRPGGL
jgi:L-iditol 2-dehydrogenase